MLYNVECWSGDAELPDGSLDASELRFCFDSDTLDCVAAVAAGDGEALVIDELTGATILIRAED